MVLAFGIGFEHEHEAFAFNKVGMTEIADIDAIFQFGTS